MSRILGIGLVALLCAGCAPGRYVTAVETPKGIVCVGMSGDMAIERLGEPVTIGRGPGGCAYASGAYFPHRLWAEYWTVEYAWSRPYDVIVAWLREGTICTIGVIPEKGYKLVEN